jgi:UDP-N-acetylmuramoyl-tripeptide--D-alanyl-D-alanine ligase
MKNMFLKLIYLVLARYAKKVIKKHKPFVIGITGSAGKGTAKEAIYQVMYDKFGDQVRKNYGSLNAEIGIPLTILGYDSLPSKFLWPCFLIKAYFKTLEKDYPKYLILEMGVEHPGDINYFSEIVNPDMGVITLIAPAHLANFKNFEALKKEKLTLIDIVKPAGEIFINADSSELSALKGERFIRVGIQNKDVDYQAANVEVDLSGTSYRITTTGQNIAIKSKLLGDQFVYSQLIAFAVGQAFGIQSLQIKKSLEKILPVNGRMHFIEGKNKVNIIDDTYNSNPEAVKAALDVLNKMKYHSRKVAIIGNMNELGDFEKEAHLSIGKYAKDRCDLAIFIGQNSKLMQKGYGDEKSSKVFESKEDLYPCLEGIIKSEDLVLIKASQNKNYFEEITKRLMSHREDATKLLVRQSSFWLKKKNVTE